MSRTTRIESRVLPEHRGMRLDQFLVRLFEDPKTKWISVGQPVALEKLFSNDFKASRGWCRRLVESGNVFLEEKQCRILSLKVIPGVRVALVVDLDVKGETAVMTADAGALKTKAAGSPTARLKLVVTSEDVLYEDDFLIIFHKPAGIPTQATVDPNRDHFYGAAQRFVDLRAREMGDRNLAYLGLHHRLDRDTSGVLLMTKNKEANGPIADMFKQHQFQKLYRARVRSEDLELKLSRLKNSTVDVDNFLRFDRELKKVDVVHSGGDRALTRFRLIEEGPTYSIIEAQPRTGRMHQIRVHLAGLGTPIVGDLTYGGKRADRMYLHAFQLTFVHPFTEQELTVEAELPSELLKI